MLIVAGQSRKTIEGAQRPHCRSRDKVVCKLAKDNDWIASYGQPY